MPVSHVTLGLGQEDYPAASQMYPNVADACCLTFVAASARVFPLPGYSAYAYVATKANLLPMLGRALSHPSPWS